MNEEITRTSVIYHNIGFVNDKLERNYHFFVDILKEGIILLDSGKFFLSQPKDLNPAQRIEKSTEEFEHWFESASNFLLSYQDTFNRANYKEAAFLLHQTTERLRAA